MATYYRLSAFSCWKLQLPWQRCITSDNKSSHCQLDGGSPRKESILMSTSWIARINFISAPRGSSCIGHYIRNNQFTGCSFESGWWRSEDWWPSSRTSALAWHDNHFEMWWTIIRPSSLRHSAYWEVPCKLYNRCRLFTEAKKRETQCCPLYIFFCFYHSRSVAEAWWEERIIACVDSRAQRCWWYLMPMQ